MNKQTATVSIKSWCDDCAAASEATGYGRDGHFMCSKPVVPAGYRLTGAKELTTTGWREDAEPVDHLLARHAAATRAVQAVATFQFDRKLDGDALLAELAAWRAALDLAQETRSALATALHAAQWGAQPDGSFVTRASLTCGGMASRSTLHAPAKQGPLAEVEDHERGDGYTLTALRTREEARTIRDVERCENRDVERMYAALRRRAGAVLRDGGELPYSPGQECGTVEIHDRRVSAKGALVAAGMTKAEAEAVFPVFPEEPSGVSYEYRLSLRGVSVHFH